MKALSIRAPWWWFILHGGKDIENRDWPTRYRGWVLVHASKWFQPEEVRENFSWARGVAESTGHKLPGPVTLRALQADGGHIVGRVKIVDCVSKSDSPWFCGAYGFVLTKPEPIVCPVPIKGALGVFTVPDEAMANAEFRQ